MKLDRTRDFGWIFGEVDSKISHVNEDGEARVAVAEQDGYLFDKDDALIRDLLTPAQVKQIAKREAEAKAKAAAEEAFAKAMGEFAPAAGDNRPRITLTDPDAKVNPNDEEVDLLAWGRGRKKYRFDLVASEITKRFNIAPVTQDQARAILRDEGVLPPLAA
jgi:hypothetical protein